MRPEPIHIIILLGLLVIVAVVGLVIVGLVKLARKRTRAGVPSTAAAAAGGTMADELTKLADLHRRGALSDEEYSQQKQRLLGATGDGR